MGGLWIGTSGWTYDGWRGPFYPEELAKKDWLSWYATRFGTTEINGSFYRTPSLEAAKAWRHEVLDDNYQKSAASKNAAQSMELAATGQKEYNKPRFAFKDEQS